MLDFLEMHLLLCLEAFFRKEGKATHPLRFIPLTSMGAAGWVGNRELGGQSPQSSKLPPCPGDGDGATELLEARQK